MNSIDILNNPTGPGWHIPLSERLEALLTPVGALNLLGVAIRMAPRDEGLELMSAAMRDLTCGQPMVPFFCIADEAKHWATYASLEERKYYAAAIFNTFTPDERAAFLGFADRRAAA